MSLTSGFKDNSALETAASFLTAIKKGDSRTFWNTLDKRGQGYFLGLWFYAMETMNIETIIKLTGEKEFLDGVLGPIMQGLRESISEILESPRFGEIEYLKPHWASVKILPSDNSGDPTGDLIPLVLELCDSGCVKGDVNLTCWKVDTLQCFQLNKGINQ